MIDLLTLDCGCQFDSGSWDLCMAHREDGMTTKDGGPIPLSGLDEEPISIWPIVDNIRSIFDAASGRTDPYEVSTRQARAERGAKKTALMVKVLQGIAKHCPTCTCKKEK